MSVFSSLRFRLAAAFFAIVLVTLLAAFTALFARMTGYRDDVQQSTLKQVAAPIYYNLTLFQPVTGAGATVQGRRLRAELEEYLRLQSEAGVIVLLLDANGMPIPGSVSDPALADERFDVPPPPARGPDFADLPQGRHVTNEGQALVYVTAPTPRLVRGQPAGIHAIVVALPETSRQEAFRDLAPRLLFAGAIGLFAAVIALAVLWASLGRTLGKVTGAIRAVAAGDYGQRVPVSGPAEVRALAADVNRMADSVEASQRTLREFLANVSHELKTPLTSIRGFSQAMLDGTLTTPEERARAARVIDVETRRVLLLVGELLDLSRIESGQQPMDVADVAAGELLAHARDVFALRAEEQNVTLVVHGAGDRRVVRADFDRIEQVLGNLLDNAFRHTPAGGRVETGVRDAGSPGFVEFYVSDDGAGIAPDDLPHVFDRFYRSALGEPEMPGSGLGLAISREIVRAHGGAIRAEAGSRGGAEFAFTLPLASGTTSASAPLRPDEPAVG